MGGVTHVIHCAGCTKSVAIKGFYEVNQTGTRNVVEAVNTGGTGVRRLVHVSSQAAGGPASADHPAREDDLPQPISEYGKSKLAGEMEVRQGCRTDFAIVRPPAVYGPRDRGFYSLFQAVQHHLRPQPSAPKALSLVYVEDLAEAITRCLDLPAATRQTYYACASEVVTGLQMADVVARQMKRWTIPVPLPAAVLWPACAFQDLLARLTRKARLLNLAKYPELRAHGWVCSGAKLERDFGWSCKTGLEAGVSKTLRWYRENHWL